MSHPKVAPAEHDILDVIRRRWSPRAFDTVRPVARADLLRLFEAARWAPSSRNEQPWRFVVAERDRTPEAFDTMAGVLLGTNPAWAPAAPVLVLIAVRTTHERDDSVNRVAHYDTGQAVGFLTLQATAMGLAARQMAGFDREQARAAVGVPEPFEPAVMMAIGYLGTPETLPEGKQRDDEHRPRSRRVIDEIVFDGWWGRPYTSSRRS